MLLSVKELKGFLEQKNVSSTGCTEKRDLVDVIINHQARPQVETSRVNETRTNQPRTNEPYSNTQPLASSSSSQQHAQSQPRSRATSQGMNDIFGGLQINPEISNFVQSIFRLDEGGIRGLRPPSLDELNNRRSQSSEQMSFGVPAYQDDFTPSCVRPTQVSNSTAEISVSGLLHSYYLSNLHHVCNHVLIILSIRSRLNPRYLWEV